MTFTPSWCARWLNSARPGVVRDFLGLRADDFLVRQGPLGDVQQRLLGEMADQTGIGAMLDHRRGPGLLPRGDHPPQVHVPPVERPLGRVLVARSGVRIPQLHRRVDVQHAVVVAPLHDLAAVDVPGQVDQEVAGRQMLAEERAHVLFGDALLDEGHAALDPGPERRLVRSEIHDGDALRIDVDEAQKNGQRASRDGPETNEQDSVRKGQHPVCDPWSSPEMLHENLRVPAALLVLLTAPGRQIVRDDPPRNRPWTENR